jgi:hypothetical protein
MRLVRTFLMKVPSGKGRRQLASTAKAAFSSEVTERIARTEVNRAI